MTEMIKVEDLTARHLDFYVAKAEGKRVSHHKGSELHYWIHCEYNGDDDFQIPFYSTKYETGGPLIEQHGISVNRVSTGEWISDVASGKWQECGEAPTFLRAAMVAFVKFKFGNEVEKLC